MKTNHFAFLGFLTATASVFYILENLILRTLPIPFLRLGLANIIMLFLVWRRNIWQAYTVTIAKTLIGGIVTLTLMSPAILLSLTGAVLAVTCMSLGVFVRPRLSLTGISILGAISHNLGQLLIARQFIITTDSLFVLTPILILLGLFSGVITAYLCYYTQERIPAIKAYI
ncbi:MAG: Gx transporter family protein [Candidatus Cloacimonetes bacterium]|jgi:heptaprenyl diphosphate synthase|nr:Gx transporter family protein [Candidatus Cloacimonadota bacterium]MDY0299452.1 Gx transporter family protein [Candidatus Cloacimonadaceae bacterium]MCB5278459.1 Gx transporter family protein [Candidatus Cloacimonadota bacterium]MCK9332693.1 Gx transporter family protein [Candidatus Cloacimonadota bacterium]MDD2210034.1 Gx transporter family protein [Candidatus Cloacimonadota bacterium]